MDKWRGKVTTYSTHDLITDDSLEPQSPQNNFCRLVNKYEYCPDLWIQILLQMRDDDILSAHNDGSDTNYELEYIYIYSIFTDQQNLDSTSLFLSKSWIPKSMTSFDGFRRCYLWLVNTDGFFFADLKLNLSVSAIEKPRCRWIHFGKEWFSIDFPLIFHWFSMIFHWFSMIFHCSMDLFEGKKYQETPLHLMVKTTWCFLSIFPLNQSIEFCDWSSLKAFRFWSAGVAPDGVFHHGCVGLLLHMRLFGGRSWDSASAEKLVWRFPES